MKTFMVTFNARHSVIKTNQDLKVDNCRGNSDPHITADRIWKHHYI